MNISLIEGSFPNLQIFPKLDYSLTTVVLVLFLKRTLWPHFITGIHLPQGY